MRRCGWRWLAGLPFLALLSVSAAAEPFYGCSLAPQTADDHPNLSDESKDRYLCAGREYLRAFLRDRARRFMADSGVVFDLDAQEAAASLEVTSLYSQADSPLRTRVRVLANENLDPYFKGEHFSPARFEMDSHYQALSNLVLEAILEAPINDLYQMELGSAVRWNDNVDSTLTYTLRNSDRLYAGVSLGMNVHWDDWNLELAFHQTPDSVSLQNFSLGKRF